MSYNHRKRKHKHTGSAGAAHRNINYPTAATDVPEPDPFLAHHQAYQPQPQAQAHAQQPWTAPDPTSTVDPLRALYIQAHEADLVHGAAAAAESLEVVEYRAVLTASGAREIAVVPRVGSALIQWGDSAGAVGAQAAEGRLTAKAKAKAGGVDIVGSDEEDEGMADSEELALPPDVAGSVPPIWVDRYDARLLLNALPTHSPTSKSHPNDTKSTPTLHRPASPSGWSDLASDAEDTFFFTPDEAADYHREKRRRLLQQSREDRLRARMHEDGVDGAADAEAEDVWGGSDEEPDETQHALMARTAAHLQASPNPAQLEMRILANHGGDARFAFLRGRWKRAWGLAKAKARLKLKKSGEDEKKAERPVVLSSALAGYGSGSSDSEAEAGDEAGEPPETAAEVQPEPERAKRDEVSAQELRRQRLKKWTEERRALQQQQSSTK